MFPNPSYKLVVARNTGEGYQTVKTFGVSTKTKEKKYNGAIYTPNFRSITFRKGNKHFMYVDYDTGLPLTFQDLTSLGFTRDELEMMAETRLVKAVLQGAAGNIGLLVLILSAVAGFMGGVLLGPTIMGMIPH